ncbi:hypothetical protein JI57_04555 [Psychromonas sp. PRT-SC03]|nr:hypothetical protein JI57_04555 [Psychromonas sp. PRT-SC03]
MHTIAVKEQTKSIEESQAEIHALFGVSTSVALVWDSLETADKRIFCFAAGLKKSHIDQPLGQFGKLDRPKLLHAIKEIGNLAKQFSALSHSDFK